MGKTRRKNSNYNRTRKQRHRGHGKHHGKHHSKHHGKQTGGGFSFTGVLASVILSVGSVMGLKESGMF